MDNSAASQRQRILAWLKSSRALSTLEARQHLDVLHPAARVMELRQAGHNIATHWRTDHNGRGRPHRVASYVLLVDREAA